MSEYISADLRRLVIARAERLCEYCLIHEDDTFFGCEIDHIISVKHGGPTEADNLALACAFCNLHKAAIWVLFSGRRVSLFGSLIHARINGPSTLYRTVH